MGSWNELVEELGQQQDDRAKAEWLCRKQKEALRQISQIRGSTNVIFYASAWLQKPTAPPVTTQLTSEELNGFMSVVRGLDWNKGLTLLLHTPGGQLSAVETVAAYLHSKFPCIEVIVPTYAMSAGTMLCLAANRVVMGRQSQLGPTDPQMVVGPSQMVSACAIVDQFERAKADIEKDLRMAHLWAPILQSLGPALLQEANRVLDYAETMVARWLQSHMFKDMQDAGSIAKKVASYFRGSEHKSHGRRIDREEARSQGVVVEDLEADQTLQDAVLTAYHLATITMENSPASNILLSHQGTMWVKNLGPVIVQKPI